MDCVPHRELNDTVILFCIINDYDDFDNLDDDDEYDRNMYFLKVSLYKKLMALLPAPEGCARDEESSLSTTEVFLKPTMIKRKSFHI